MPDSSIILLHASLRGVGREAECDILVRKSDRNQPAQYSQCSIISAPTDLQDGEYRVEFEGHIAKVQRKHGAWRLPAPVSRNLQ